MSPAHVRFYTRSNSSKSARNGGARAAKWSSPTAVTTFCTRPYPSAGGGALAGRCAGAGAQFRRAWRIGAAASAADEQQRAAAAMRLEAVDAVVLFEEDTPRELIAAVLPDILVKGADWSHFGGTRGSGSGGRRSAPRHWNRLLHHRRGRDRRPPRGAFAVSTSGLQQLLLAGGGEACRELLERSRRAGGRALLAGLNSLQGAVLTLLARHTGRPFLVITGSPRSAKHCWNRSTRSTCCSRTAPAPAADSGAGRTAG